MQQFLCQRVFKPVNDIEGVTGDLMRCRGFIGIDSSARQQKEGDRQLEDMGGIMHVEVV